MELEKSIQLDPQFFGPSLRKTLIQKLKNSVEGQSSVRHGFIIAVSNILSVGSGILEG